jgi:hypothetical protein
MSVQEISDGGKGPDVDRARMIVAYCT